MSDLEKVPLDYCRAVYVMSRLKKNQRFLVADETRDFVSLVMANRVETKDIWVYGMSQILVPWYQTILKVATCPVKIVLALDDESEWVSRLPRKTKRPIMCWQRATQAQDGENHFLVFGSDAFLFDTTGKGTMWLGNFKELKDIWKLKDRFKRYLEEPNLRSIDLHQTVLV